MAPHQQQQPSKSAPSGKLWGGRFTGIERTLHLSAMQLLIANNPQVKAIH
jgi:hypothetical protein